MQLREMRWLAGGGAHTGGNYFTMELDSLTFFDYYGGPADVSVEQYLQPTQATPFWHN